MNTRISLDFAVVHALIILALLIVPTPGVFGQVMYSATDLGVLPGGEVSYAFGINNNGQVVCYCTSTSGLVHAFLYSGGAITDLGVLPGFSGSVGEGINNNGQVVGYCISGTTHHAFLYSGGSMTDLGVPPGFTDSYAYGINNNGQVVGYCWNRSSGLIHAFLYSGGAITDLGVLANFWLCSTIRG